MQWQSLLRQWILREHISERLKRNEDIEDNKKMIQILDLFKKNSLIMELAKEDVEKWLAFFDAIEQKLEENNGVKLTEKELNDINQIKRLTKDLKEMIRK
jgi:benzoyl-CoA reductase/2-hydroxyglutaryl-CoA dehydratase subunit BcrC/BadD/HgdB